MHILKKEIAEVQKIGKNDHNSLVNIFNDESKRTVKKVYFEKFKKETEQLL